MSPLTATTEAISTGLCETDTGSENLYVSDFVNIDPDDDKESNSLTGDIRTVSAVLDELFEIPPMLVSLLLALKLFNNGLGSVDVFKVVVEIDGDEDF